MLVSGGFYRGGEGAEGGIGTGEEIEGEAAIAEHVAKDGGFTAVVEC